MQIGLETDGGSPRSHPPGAELVRHLQRSIEATSGPEGQLENQIRFPQTVDYSRWGQGYQVNGFRAAA